MAATTFTSKTTVINTAWLNDVNTLVWTIFNGLSVIPTSGKIVQSNGTNLVGSVFTLPTTIGASGTILRSNGTNFATWGTTIPDTGTSGGILAYTASGTLVSSAALTANALVLGGGAGVVPSTPVGLGTTTTVLHGNAAGAPSYSAVTANDFGTQTANTVLAGPTSGSVATPTFRALTSADGSSLVLLSTQTASSSATLDFINLTGYISYIFFVDKIRPATDGAALLLRISTNNGSSYAATSYQYATWEVAVDSSTGSPGSSSATSISLAAAVGNSSTNGVWGTIITSNLAATGTTLCFNADLGRFSTTQLVNSKIIGYYPPGGPVNAVRFLFSSGNIADGTIRCYGVRG